MTLKPRHRELCVQLIDALRESTSLVLQEEKSGTHTIAQGSCDAIDTRLLEIQEDVDLLKSATKLLEMQQATLQRRKTRTHNTLQPIFNLPDEILTLIFEIGVPVPSEQWSRNPCESPATQWTFDQYQKKLRSVGAVCEQFRVALLNSPRCWTYVTYILRKDTDEGPRLEAFDTMLRRSKGVPFNLRVKISTKGTRPSASSLQEITRVVLPHMHRCERLYLECDDRGVDFPVFVGPADPLRSLRYITFDWNDDATKNSDRNKLDSKAGQSIVSLVSKIKQPLLSLTLNGLLHVHQRLDVDFLAIQVHALTRLRIDARCRMSDAVALLRRCTGLEHLFWAPQLPSREFEDSAMAVSHPLSPITLENLISLRVDSDLPPCVLLNAPHLEQITLMFGDSFDIMNPEQPVLPALRRLSLFEPYSNVGRMAAFVRRHPRLVELETSNITHLSSVIDSLMSPSADAKDAHHPYLRRLSLRTTRSDFLGRPKAVGSVQSLLRKQENIRLDLRLNLRDPSELDSHTGDSDILKQFKEGFNSRIELEPPKRLSDTWHDAWGEWQRPGYW